MDIGAVLLVLTVVVVVAAVVSRPFFQPQAAGAAQVSEREHARSSLLAEQERLLTALQELDFDQAMGKIPAEDYPVQRAALLQQASQVLRELDKLGASAPVNVSSQTAEDRLEAAIARRRADARIAGGAAAGGSAVQTVVSPEDPLEELISKRRRARSENTAGFCPRCGKPVQKSDRFCPKCGHGLSA